MPDETTQQAAPPPELQKTLVDPEFLKLGPEDQVATLKHILSLSSPTLAPASAKVAPAGSLPTPPKAEPPNNMWSVGDVGRAARETALGAASGAGIPESTDWVDVVGGGLKNAIMGPITLGKAAVHDLVMSPEFMRPGALAAPIVDPETGQVSSKSDLANIAMDTAKGLWDSGTEMWQGAKDKDQDKFFHGFGSFTTQALLVKSLAKMRDLNPAKVGEREQLAKIAKAIEAGPEQFADLKTAMPEIIKGAKQAGLKDVGELGDAISKAHGQVEQQFNQALAPVARMRYLPTEIATSLRNLITPDMLKDYNMIESAKQAAQRAGLRNPRFKFSDNAWKTHDAVVEIQRQAREFERPWTIQELNARRMTENEKLRGSSFYNKDTRGQAAAENKVQTATSQAVADGSRDIVYNQISKANPGLDARAIKLKQGSLWALDDYINHPKRGLIADLEAQQAQVEGSNRLENVRAGVSVGKTLVPHGYLSGLMEAIAPHDPMKSANAKVKGAFEPSLTQKATRAWALSLPLTALTAKRPGSLPSPPAADEAGE